MKRQSTVRSRWRATSPTQREVSHAQGHTGSQKNSTSATSAPSLGRRLARSGGSPEVDDDEGDVAVALDANQVEHERSLSTRGADGEPALPSVTWTGLSRNAVLLLSCRDRPGIVAAVAGFVTEIGGNIVEAEQHTDTHDGMFFQRVEFT